MSHEVEPHLSPERADRFATTHWSMVVRAGRGHTPGANRALATLCENYWFPLYAFVRRAGHAADEAQDLTQAFFAELLAKDVLAVADPQRGKFRSFLQAAVKHFLAKEHRRQGAQKRGGHQSVLSLDFQSGEERYRRLEPADNLTPERLYEKRWALALLDLVFVRLRAEFSAAGKLPLFECLKLFLAGRPSDISYLAVAEEVGMSEGAVKVAVHRLRRRYRDLLKEEIAQTVTGPDELDDELRDLWTALASGK
jgi:RNA polymerase sigma factor (sigma-70 family)